MSRIPVKFIRQEINNSINGKLRIGEICKGNVVLAVKFCNQGTNSKLGVGDGDGMEWIEAANDPEVSFGTGAPYCIEDEFTIKFEKIDSGISDANTVHKGLVVMTVEKIC